MKISNDVRGGSEKIGEGGFQCEVWSGVEWSGVESATKTTRKRDSRATVKRKRKKKETRKGKKKNQVSLPMFSYCSLQSSYVHPENKVSRRCQTQIESKERFSGKLSTKYASYEWLTTRGEQVVRQSQRRSQLLL